MPIRTVLCLRWPTSLSELVECKIVQPFHTRGLFLGDLGVTSLMMSASTGRQFNVPPQGGVSRRRAFAEFSSLWTAQRLPIYLPR